MGTVIEFKRQGEVTPTRRTHRAEPKRTTGCWLDTDQFDEISRYLFNPEVPYEDRVQWLNNWRIAWKLEPLEIQEA